jgi:hypothetical protein
VDARQHRALAHVERVADQRAWGRSSHSGSDFEPCRCWSRTADANSCTNAFPNVDLLEVRANAEFEGRASIAVPLRLVGVQPEAQPVLVRHQSLQPAL